jgi:hypothetical protein
MKWTRNVAGVDKSRIAYDNPNGRDDIYADLEKCDVKV